LIFQFAMNLDVMQKILGLTIPGPILKMTAAKKVIHQLALRCTETSAEEPVAKVFLPREESVVHAILKGDHASTQ